jgi:menaquinone-9 beta-reductase
MSMADLIVIGGGPAGTAAAITAVRAGARVMLLEAGRLPRHKVCGEFVSSESLGLLSELLDRNRRSLLSDAARVSRSRLFVDGRELSAKISPAAASIARFDLDLALFESAKSSGVEAVQLTRVLEVRNGKPSTVRTSAGEIEAGVVVNASGRWSNLHGGSQANHKGSEKWIGLKAHFTEASPALSVDLYFFSGGYCGVQPVGPQRVNACAMVRADAASSLAEVFELHPALCERSRHWRMVTDPVSVAPLRFGTPQPVGDGVINVGDAAGFVDPFIGDGISLALRSGALAAECLAGCLDGTISQEDAARRYAGAYEASFGTVFRSSARLRRALVLPKSVRIPILAVLQKSPAITNYLVRMTR